VRASSSKRIWRGPRRNTQDFRCPLCLNQAHTFSCAPDEVSSCRIYSQGVCQRFPIRRLIPSLSHYDMELRAKPKESHIMTGTNQRMRSQTNPTCCEIRHSMYFTTGFSGTKSNLGGSGAWKLPESSRAIEFVFRCFSMKALNAVPKAPRTTASILAVTPTEVRPSAANYLPGSFN